MAFIGFTYVVGLLCCYSLYLIYLILYRLYFSPIASFPGPRLAALTFWYEFYHDVLRRGQYEFEIAYLHKQYGPIVRINPYELHIDDPDYYDTVYPGASSSRRTDKWSWAMKQFGTYNSAFGTSPHDLHRSRRGAIAPLFSKRAVSDLEPVIQQYVDQLKARLHEKRGATVNLFNAFGCLTGDIITDYCFGRSLGLLQDENFTPEWHKMMHSLGEIGLLCKQFGWVFPLMRLVPPWLGKLLNPALAKIMQLEHLIQSQIALVSEQSQSQSDMKASTLHRTVFHEILQSPLPPAEKRPSRLMQEGSVLVSAGTATTADTLGVISFYLLRYPHILHRAQTEIRQCQNLRDLEQMPYLSAVIQEGLRMAHPVCQRLPRISPDADLQFREYTIPGGTPVSMSIWQICMNADIFPSPRDFRPERWLEESSGGDGGGGGGEGKRDLVPYHQIAFSKGTRQCVALNLAYAEMYLALAVVFGSGLKLDLFETDESDVEMVRDQFVVGVRDDSKGVRVRTLSV